jgi:hypothetical protein
VASSLTTPCPAEVPKGEGGRCEVADGW